MSATNTEMIAVVAMAENRVIGDGKGLTDVTGLDLDLELDFLELS